MPGVGRLASRELITILMYSKRRRIMRAIFVAVLTSILILSIHPRGNSQGHGTRPKKRHTIAGGVLNAKAISKPMPPYPPIAKRTKLSGFVVVRVLVDEEGNVISAKALTGHRLLRKAAVKAAYQAKFEPTTLSGQPVRVSGVLTYDFESGEK
jgi:TonB family protein